MAQQVVIAGALFNDVPAISVPDSNNVYHDFLDTTIATNAASASDIASGKLAYVNGSLITGTGSGGGGTLKVGAIRPDAVLDTSWTYDKYIVADEHVTIPAYSTSAQTLKAVSTLVSGKYLDLSQYDFLLVGRGISQPIYSTTSKGKGRAIYSAFSYAYEITCVPKSIIIADNVTSSRYLIYGNTTLFTPFIAYWNSASEVRAASSSYGAYQSFPSGPDLTTDTTNGTGTTINITSPRFEIRGSATYLSSTYWGYITDIRFQYIIELWKVPRTGNINGWIETSQLVHAVNCAQSVSGTLT